MAQENLNKNMRHEIELVREIFGVNPDVEIRSCPEGFVAEVEELGLELVIPYEWHYDLDHRLISPLKFFADTKGRIPKTLGVSLESTGWGFMVGRFDSEEKRFYTLEATIPGQAWNCSDILLCAFFDRTAGACGLGKKEIHGIKHRYHHLNYDDEYKLQGTHTFILAAEDYSGVANLIHKTTTMWRNWLNNVAKAWEKFQTEKSSYGQQMIKDSERLLDTNYDGVRSVQVDPREDYLVLRVEYEDESDEHGSGKSECCHESEVYTAGYYYDRPGAEAFQEDVAMLISQYGVCSDEETIKAADVASRSSEETTVSSEETVVATAADWHPYACSLG